MLQPTLAGTEMARTRPSVISSDGVVARWRQVHTTGGLCGNAIAQGVCGEAEWTAHAACCLKAAQLDGLSRRRLLRWQPRRRLTCILQEEGAQAVHFPNEPLGHSPSAAGRDGQQRWQACRGGTRHGGCNVHAHHPARSSSCGGLSIGGKLDTRQHQRQNCTGRQHVASSAR